MVVTLIGYRASGKSSVAPRVAKRLGWSWFDSDVVIEQQAGVSIKDIFQHEGEAGFRKRESEVLANLLTKSNSVIASGGGAILSEENRRLIKSAGPVVWLQAPVDVLVRRLGGDQMSTQRRPSLTGKPIGAEVAEVLAFREPLYRECATLIVDAGAERPEQMARRIAEHVTSLQATQEKST
ncbi:MAG: shikimate kinase AroL [Planctomycetaceae bacterium]